MVSTCCQAPLDYQYGTWHSCRVCRKWIEVVPQQKAKKAPADLVFRVAIPVIHSSKAHATYIASTSDAEPVALL